MKQWWSISKLHTCVLGTPWYRVISGNDLRTEQRACSRKSVIMTAFDELVSIIGDVTDVSLHVPLKWGGQVYVPLIICHRQAALHPTLQSSLPTLNTLGGCFLCCWGCCLSKQEVELSKRGTWIGLPGLLALRPQQEQGSWLKCVALFFGALLHLVPSDLLWCPLSVKVPPVVSPFVTASSELETSYLVAPFLWCLIYLCTLAWLLWQQNIYAPDMKMYFTPATYYEMKTPL